MVLKKQNQFSVVVQDKSRFNMTYTQQANYLAWQNNLKCFKDYLDKNLLICKINYNRATVHTNVSNNVVCVENKQCVQRTCIIYSDNFEKVDNFVKVFE